MADISVVKLPNNSSYNLRDANAVHKTGNETAGGNKTFSGTTTLTSTSKVSIPANTIIDGSDSSYILSSPIPKYLWHDLFAFNRQVTPTYYTTTDNSTWTEATLEKRLFCGKEAWGKSEIISKTGKSGSRWIWSSNAFSWGSARWLVIGGAYSDPCASTTVTFEGSRDNSTWTTYFTSTWVFNAVPVWLYVKEYSDPIYLRLTITKDSTNTTSYKNITSIKLLTYRWGDQGRGSEYEYPFDWDADSNVLPVSSNTKSLGSSSLKWSNVYTTKLNNVNVPSITAGIAGTSSATSGTNTLAIPYVTYNAAGMITAAGTHTHTISAATTSAPGLMSSTDKSKLDGISSSYNSSTETLTINL